MKAYLAGVIAFLVTSGATVAFLSAAEDGGDAAGAPAPLAMLPPADAASVAAEGLAAPDWREGYSWRVQFSPSGAACRVSVVEAGDDGYRQAFACDGARSIAIEEAVYDYAFMGRFDAQLNALMRDADPVRWYDWPLVDGKRWTTSVGGRDVEVVAAYDAELSGPAGPEPGFRLSARDGGDVIVEYDYVPSIGWWSRFAVSGGFRMDVDAFRPDWRGQAVDAEAERRFFHTGSQVAGNGGFAGEESDDFVHLYRAYEGPRSGSLRVLAPDGSVAYEDGANGVSDGATSTTELLPGQAGSWRLEFPTFSRGLTLRIHGIDLHEHVR